LGLCLVFDFRLRRRLVVVHDSRRKMDWAEFDPVSPVLSFGMSQVYRMTRIWWTDSVQITCPGGRSPLFILRVVPCGAPKSQGYSLIAAEFSIGCSRCSFRNVRSPPKKDI
jgi:hypothetical protein